ncbi:hypothetical protein DFH07DRAFT_772744 [Mycena maculata]|uniref:Uncharacterized protein n=1 Tax=Mycena maculata TaxID=230809 RepID=A0AAD7J5S8_9AGAR|nr:hypothetical protein DFH07DRAFT_772744 [Mycena maculata]
MGSTPRLLLLMVLRLVLGLELGVQLRLIPGTGLRGGSWMGKPGGITPESGMEGIDIRDGATTAKATYSQNQPGGDSKALCKRTLTPHHTSNAVHLRKKIPNDGHVWTTHLI